MRLIITEKTNAARRIAEILGGDDTRRSDRQDVPIYRWDDTVCVGLRGHVMSVDFPDEYADWHAVDPVELLDVPVIKRASEPGIVAAVEDLAREAEHVTIATDYDREGELIGKEAYEIVRGVNDAIPIDRVRFSSLTAGAVTEAFEHPDELDFDLAAAGEARQIVDLVWGAALTRFLSLSARRYGDDFISVGRVQSPTLKLLVDREREIQAFEPEDYWELYAELATDGETFEAQYVYTGEDGTQATRLWDEATADERRDALEAARSATVAVVDRRTRRDYPPEPFNTTQFIRAAGAIGFGAQDAMSVAEDLYTAGYITYPRTDNTVYPDDLEPRELLRQLAGHPDLGEDAYELSQVEDLSPTRGDEETTDHPPIHPTGELPDRGDLTDREWRVYELVARRYFATLAETAVWEHLRVEVEANDLTLKANGKRLLDPGYHRYYPYFNTSENLLPALEEGQRLDVAGVDLAAKQTEPPRRIGQSRLVETMDRLGIGTKSTRHNTIEKLYRRGYVEGDPPQPTNLAMAVVEAAEEYADRIVSERMTAELEEEMAAIADGELTLAEVTERSREVLAEIFEDLDASSEEIGDLLRESLKADKAIGPCPACGETLLLRKGRGGSHFVGCDGYPACEFTLPLPRKGTPTILDDVCEEHGLHEIRMLAGRGTFTHGCPRCVAEAAGELERIGPCPDCGETHGGELAVKQLASGSRLVGCTRYPDCRTSYPLPRRGEVEVDWDDICDRHGLPGIVIHDGDDPWELGCPICNYEAYTGDDGAETDGSLESIRGIGEKTAAKLADAGIEDVDALEAAAPDEVAEAVDGISADRVREWQAQV
ncbi:MAG: DNA topoisomerase I [Halobacteriales archaeon]